ncbi:ATP-dependent RNA helicase DDX24, partial [Geodia barretti]
MLSLARRRKRGCFRPLLKKKMAQRRRVKHSQSREQTKLQPKLSECLHGDSPKAPPTNQEKGREGRKRRRREVGRTPKKKMKKSELGAEEGNGMEVDESGIETVTGMEAWQEMGVPLPIIRALKDLGFTSPTEIQQQAIPVAMNTTRDVIGAAETGSGKTLAFSIPILNYIITNDARGKLLREKRGDVTMTSLKNREQKKKLQEAEVIDLNLVYHDEQDENDDDEEDHEREGQSESETESSLGDNNEGASVEERGLVTSLDNIPEDVFLKMITDNDVTITSSETRSPTSNSRDEGSHDPCDDVTESHDQAKLLALILTPTRELALQIQHHIRAAAKYTGIKVCVLVGGMADAKQERMLSQSPPIVVATPGRLWKLMSEGHPYLTSLDSIRYLVLDEADRMIDFGHYHELSWILERVNKGAESGAGPGVEGTRCQRQQMFVFSATLSLPRRSSEKKSKVRRRKNLSGQETIENLISQVGLRENAAIIDVARATGTTETLSEMKIMCSSEEKFLYLYHFLLRYKGRTLVFVNSISTLQKLRSHLELLQLHPLPLHARMQQRQRLKNFDRWVK